MPEPLFGHDGKSLERPDARRSSRIGARSNRGNWSHRAHGEKHAIAPNPQHLPPLTLFNDGMRDKIIEQRARKARLKPAADNHIGLDALGT